MENSAKPMINNSLVLFKIQFYLCAIYIFMSDLIFTYKNSFISYADAGNGPALVLLHGFLENKTMWSGLVDKMSARYRIISVDLLGHGKSDDLGYIHTMKDQAEVVYTLLKHLRLRKYVMVGHSTFRQRLPSIGNRQY